MTASVRVRSDRPCARLGELVGRKGDLAVVRAVDSGSRERWLWPPDQLIPVTPFAEELLRALFA